MARYRPVPKLTRSAVTRWLLPLVALGFTIHYLSLAFSRVLYPFDLEFVEDAMLMQALRVAQGQPVFQAPNAIFVPQVYMPLYTWLGGLLLKITGPSLLPLRFLSLTATLVTASFLYMVARREGADRHLAFAGSAIFLAGYQIVGGWYELARVDMLFVALLLSAMAVAIYAHNSAWGLIGAGILMGLALLTKQNGLFLALLIAGYLFLSVRWRVWMYVLAFALVGGIPILWLQLSSNGWFSFYVFSIAFASPLAWQRVINTLVREVMGAMAVLTAAFMALVALSVRWGRWPWVQQRPWPLFIAGALFVSVAGRSTVGGNVNNLIPGYTLLCLAPALLAVEIKRSPVNWKGRAYPILYTLLIVQFGLTFLNPMPGTPADLRPTKAMRAAGDRLIAELSTAEGAVMVMLHPFYALLAGKEPAVHIQSLWHARRRGQDPLPADLVARIENQDFALIVSDESAYFETEPALLKLLKTNYVRAEDFGPDSAPPTLSGVTVRPLSRYIPRATTGN